MGKSCDLGKQISGWANEAFILAHEGVTLEPKAHVLPPGQPIPESRPRHPAAPFLVFSSLFIHILILLYLPFFCAQFMILIHL
jgi:hypothetical protein